MSIASLGIASSLASTALPQRAVEADKAHRESADQSRALAATESAASASGIGEAEEDSQTSDRDADGRRPWEQPPSNVPSCDPEAGQNLSEPIAKDPSGARGNLLDLVG